MWNNDISHYQLGVVLVASDRAIIRNNTFHDQFETEAGSNGHSDSITRAISSSNK